MTQQEVISKLTKPFLTEWWCESAYAHGDADYEHYGIKFFDPQKKKIIKSVVCDAGCGHHPFENLEGEFDKFDDMGKREYWKSYGVPDEFIKERAVPPILNEGDGKNK